MWTIHLRMRFAEILRRQPSPHFTSPRLLTSVSFWTACSRKFVNEPEITHYHRRWAAHRNGWHRLTVFGLSVCGSTRGRERSNNQTQDFRLFPSKPLVTSHPFVVCGLPTVDRIPLTFMKLSRINSNQIPFQSKRWGSQRTITAKLGIRACRFIACVQSFANRFVGHLHRKSRVLKSDRILPLQQPFLIVQATTISCQLAVAANHSMARDDN